VNGNGNFFCNSLWRRGERRSVEIFLGCLLGGKYRDMRNIGYAEYWDVRNIGIAEYWDMRNIEICGILGYAEY
jgi:hypothetical protein